MGTLGLEKTRYPVYFASKGYEPHIIMIIVTEMEEKENEKENRPSFLNYIITF